MASLDTRRDAAIIAGMHSATRTVRPIGALLLVTALTSAWGAQFAAAGRGAGEGAGEQAAGQPRRQGLYPALQRPAGDPELIARGQGIYGINCRACHGVDLRGGDLGGPNLLRSQLVLRDLQGELMGPVIQNGSTAADGSGMPAQPLSDEDVRAVAEYIHSILATASRQGGPPEGERVELDILVGDAAAGGPTSPRSARRATRRPATCRASRPGSPARRSSRTPGCGAGPAGVHGRR